MEFSEAQIAALVLGYLKNEKLYSVFDEFLKSCPYLTENKQNIKIGKYFATRVAGMTLVDFLKEYAVIYTIVQSRLEETNYYETYSRTSLVERVMYLLDKEVPTVTTLTPDTPVSPIKSSRITSEVDATLAHSFPENNEETSSTVESSVREQLPGIGLTSLPTQKIPITPEIALTPVDLVSSNQKSTDYLTLNSDSDFQPGGNKKTITCKTTDENSNINKIINTVEVKNTLPQETLKNIFMPRLEEFLEGFITEEVKKLPLEKSVKNNRKEEITKIKRKTLDTVLDFPSKPKKKKDEKENQHMGNLQDGSSEKGEKWRRRDSENNKKVEVKALEKNIHLLKKIDVDKFLDKVYKK